jgi:thioesterase domain-containing protein
VVGGYSTGAMLAILIADALGKRGTPVTKVLAIDPQIGPKPYNGFEFTYDGIINRITRVFDSAAISVSATKTIAATLHQIGILPDTGSDAFHNHVEVIRWRFNGSWQLLKQTIEKRFTAGGYGAIFYRSQDPLEETEALWRRYPSEFDEVLLDCSHLGMLRMPHVSRIGTDFFAQINNEENLT